MEKKEEESIFEVTIGEAEVSTTGGILGHEVFESSLDVSFTKFGKDKIVDPHSIWPHLKKDSPDVKVADSTVDDPLDKTYVPEEEEEEEEEELQPKPIPAPRRKVLFTKDASSSDDQPAFKKDSSSTSSTSGLSTTSCTSGVSGTEGDVEFDSDMEDFQTGKISKKPRRKGGPGRQAISTDEFILEVARADAYLRYGDMPEGIASDRTKKYNFKKKIEKKYVLESGELKYVHIRKDRLDRKLDGEGKRGKKFNAVQLFSIRRSRCYTMFKILYDVQDPQDMFSPSQFTMCGQYLIRQNSGNFWSLFTKVLVHQLDKPRKVETTLECGL